MRMVSYIKPYSSFIFIDRSCRSIVKPSLDATLVPRVQFNVIHCEIAKLFNFSSSSFGLFSFAKQQNGARIWTQIADECQHGRQPQRHWIRK